MLTISIRCARDSAPRGAKRPEITKVLCENSGADVEWLMDACDLDLFVAGDFAACYSLYIPIGSVWGPLLGSFNHL